jgi:hypothetical protein
VLLPALAPDAPQCCTQLWSIWTQCPALHPVPTVLNPLHNLARDRGGAFPKCLPGTGRVPNPVLHPARPGVGQLISKRRPVAPALDPVLDLLASVSPSVAPSSGPQRFPSGSQLQPVCAASEGEKLPVVWLLPPVRVRCRALLPVARLPSAQLSRALLPVVDPGRLQPLAPLPVRKSAPPVAAAHLPEQWSESVSSAMDSLAPAAGGRTPALCSSGQQFL